MHPNPGGQDWGEIISRQLFEVSFDRFHFEEFIDAEIAPLTAEAGLFIAAERQIGTAFGIIDFHSARLDGTRHFFECFSIFPEDIASETVFCIICERNRYKIRSEE